MLVTKIEEEQMMKMHLGEVKFTQEEKIDLWKKANIKRDKYKNDMKVQSDITIALIEQLRSRDFDLDIKMLEYERCWQDTEPASKYFGDRVYTDKDIKEMIGESMKKIGEVILNPMTYGSNRMFEAKVLADNAYALSHKENINE